MARLAFGVAFVAVCASIATFVAVLTSSPTGWGVLALNRISDVLVLLSIALALAVERRGLPGAWQAQIAAAAVSVAFAVVALVKLYTASSPFGFATASEWEAEAGVVALAALAFGLIGLRAGASAARVSFGTAALVAVGCVVYAISLEANTKAYLWYAVATTSATLAASAAARMQKQWQTGSS